MGMQKLIQQYSNMLSKGQRYRLCGLLLLMVGGAVVETFSIALIIPFVLAIAEHQEILRLSGLLILLYLIKNVYVYLLGCAKRKFVVQNCCEASAKIFRIYLDKPYTYYLEHNANHVITMINVYVTKAYVLIGVLMDLAAECIVSMGMIVFLLIVNFELTLLIGGIMVVTTIMLKICLHRPLLKSGKCSNEAYEGMVTSVSQAVYGIKEVKLYGVEQDITNTYKSYAQCNVDMEMKSKRLSALPNPIIEMVAIIGVLVWMNSYIKGGYSYEVFFAQMTSFALVLFRLLPATTRINSYLSSISYYLPTVLAIDEDIQEACKQGGEIWERKEQLWQLQDKIAVEGVTFAYEQEGCPNILEAACLTIRKGETIGIVGESGAGKSTLIDILLGYQQPQAGRVLVDGRDIAENLRAWQQNIGYIPQMIFMLDGSIRENVLFYSEATEEDKIWEALKRARLDTFVRGLPKGLDTQVGERGVRLSGGQRQRIGIARALYREPEVMLFDEATAALDHKTAHEIMEEIYALGEQKTIIIVSHHVETLSRCDAIVRVADGQIVVQ